MASLKGVDPDIRKYLRKHKVPDIYEAILTGLAVTCPDEPYVYITEHIQQFMNMRVETVHGLEVVKWDTLIPDELKPCKKQLPTGYMDSVFVYDEEFMQPSPAMYEKAYHKYNHKLIHMTFSAWFRYHERKKRRRAEMARKMIIAANHYYTRKQRVHLLSWHAWFCKRRDRQKIFYEVIQRVYSTALSRQVFQGWHNDMLETRRTREYFERLERGELDEDDEYFPQGAARDDISMLPRKVAIQIFSYLDLADLSHCAQVCRSWKMITGYSSLWNKVNLSSIKSRVKDHFVCSLLQKCRPYLLHLNLRGCSALTKPSYKAIAQCRNLQDLNLSECNGVNDDVMKDLTSGCPILLYLNVAFTHITDASLRLLSRCCRNLQYLSLAYCRRFTDKGLQYLATGRGCRKLVYLDLSGCVQITAVGYKNIANGCSNIQSLCVNDCITLRDDSILALASKCTQIRSISFLCTPNITDASLKALGQHKKLQKIRIESNSRITDAAFKTIGRHCTDLRHVYLVDCPRITDASLKSMAPCKNINVLNVADCIRITDTGVRQLVEGPSGPKIREMNLTNCVRVTDVSIIKIVQKCYTLVYASFCFSEHITDGGAEMLGNLTSLTSLDISGCSITDTGLGALGNNPCLRDVTLSECFQITDLGVQKFVQQCKDLERLDISHCTHLTDGSIKSLAFCCRRLTVVNLAGCKLLTDLSVQYLCGVCHYLLSLDISGLLKVTDKSMKFVRKGCKRIRTLIMLYCKGVTKSMMTKLTAKIEVVKWSDDPIPHNFGPGFDYLRILEEAEKKKKLLEEKLAAAKEKEALEKGPEDGTKEGTVDGEEGEEKLDSDNKDVQLMREEPLTSEEKLTSDEKLTSEEQLTSEERLTSEEHLTSEECLTSGGSKQEIVGDQKDVVVMRISSEELPVVDGNLKLNNVPSEQSIVSV